VVEQREFLANAIEASVRIGLLLVLAAWCFDIVRPFVIPIAWGIIIAVAQYPGYRRLCVWFGGRRRAAAILIATIDLLVLLVPAVLLSDTLLDGLQGFAKGLQDGTLAVPRLPESVKDWPLVGEPLSGFWNQASQNLAATAAKFTPQLKAAAGWLLSTAAGAGFSVLQFIIAIVIAGALLAQSEASSEFARAVAARLVGEEKGADLARLAETVVRSVTKGILGVALIQAILAGIGFMVMGIPAAGLWALLCLLLSTVQIGIFPITLPILIYVFATADTVPAVLFLIWSLIVGSLDNVLKPLVLGRGVQVPMAVIFVGAIGGFISSGIIGLFVGAVVLTLGYKLLLAWVYERAEG
jgi:predicted PurR-regulated permease PerM